MGLAVTEHAIVEAIKAAVREALENHSARDEEARGDARAALQSIESHERFCLERAKNADKQRDAMQKSIDDINALIWRASIAIMVVLLGLSTFLLANKFFP